MELRRPSFETRDFVALLRMRSVCVANLLGGAPFSVLILRSPRHSASKTRVNALMARLEGWRRSRPRSIRILPADDAVRGPPHLPRQGEIVLLPLGRIVLGDEPGIGGVPAQLLDGGANLAGFGLPIEDVRLAGDVRQIRVDDRDVPGLEL